MNGWWSGPPRHVEFVDFCTAFTAKAEEMLGGPVHNRQGRQFRCLPGGFASRVVDSSSIPRQ